MVIELDTTTGEWVPSNILVESVAVIPRDHGEYAVALCLPPNVPSDWLPYLEGIIDRLSYPNIASTPARAFAFYKRVWEETTGTTETS